MLGDEINGGKVMKMSVKRRVIWREISGQDLVLGVCCRLVSMKAEALIIAGSD